MVSRSMFEDSVSDLGLNLSDGIPQLLHHRLTLQRFDSVRVGRGRHDNEGDDSSLGARLLQFVVET